MEKNLGHATAYGYAKSKGYSGTEDEFAQLMADYASVGQSAAQSAEQASASATSASQSADTASASAQTAQTAQQTASTKASEAQQSATTATTKAQEASQSASESSQSAYTAVQAKTDAETAKQASETAQASAESSATTAQTAAQTATQKAAEAAESARTLTIDPTLTEPGQAADAKVTGDKISDLKSAINVTNEALGMFATHFETTLGQIHASTKILDVNIAQGTQFYIELSFDADSVSQFAPKFYYADSTSEAVLSITVNRKYSYTAAKNIVGIGFYGVGTIPTGIVFVRVYPFGTVVDSPTMVESVKDDLEVITSTYNYFDYSNANDNNYLNSYGYLTEHNNFCVTNYIPVKNGDVVTAKYFGSQNAEFSHVCKYSKSKSFVERISASGNSYTADFDGFVRFNVNKQGTYLLKNLYSISVNNANITKWYEYGLQIDRSQALDVVIVKVDTNTYTIFFGDFSVILFYTDNNDSNSHNWNIKRVRHGTDIIVPDGTDILGPVKLSGNDDFIGGVHGDETTNSIFVSIDGSPMDLSDIDVKKCKTLTLNMKSTVYDQQNPTTAVFDRYIQIIFRNNQMTVSNTFKALSNCILTRATNGGLIAAYNNIIKSICFNNSFFAPAPQVSVSNKSDKNTFATFMTDYGSMTVRNIKGNTSGNYEGYLQVFTNENPMRCKAYFDVYKEGSYNLTAGDLITGEFEYLFS